MAIKILPPAFANDAERLARFKREAQMLAQLNHPNIGAIHGFEDSGGVHALVLELVEGPTLADVIAGFGPSAMDLVPAVHGERGRSGKAQSLKSKAQSPRANALPLDDPKPKAARAQRPEPKALPVDEALKIARQICDALEAAHEQGIIHRDLKPANIKVREDGTVKVLDFGLAKIAEGPSPQPPAPSPYLSQSPTITTPAMTAAGMILGTAAYMSPEQAKGRPADKRSDIWAFGCVLYEMLTGERPFKGDDVADTLAAILRAEPALASLSASVPPRLTALIDRCLQKERRRRIADIADVRYELEHARETGTAMVGKAPSSWRAWATAGLAVAVAVGVSGIRLWRADPPALEMRVDIADRGQAAVYDAESFALSPDGSRIVYAASEGNRRQLYVRRLDSTEQQAIPGTDDGVLPFWSPDSKKVGFFAAGRLKHVELDGQRPVEVANALSPGGACWADDHTILFSANSGNGAIYRVPENGGLPIAVTKYTIGSAHRFPTLLPDGKHLIYTNPIAAPDAARGILVGDLDPSHPPRLLVDATRALYADGELLFVRQGALFAQRFDPTAVTLTGEPMLVANNVTARSGGAVSVSSNGLLAYRTGGAAVPPQQLTWFDRRGAPLSTVGSSYPAIGNPALSRDGRQLLVQRTTDGNVDLWTVDLSTGVMDRLTTRPGIDSQGLWAPDGQSIIFASARSADFEGGTELYRLDLATGKDSPLFGSRRVNIPSDWHESTLLFRQIDATSNRADIYGLNITRGEPFPVVATESDERDAQFHPGGRWIAYQADNSGRFEAYVQPFPGPGRRRRVSVNGGRQVRWSAEGKELFYIDAEDRLVSIPIAVSANGDSPEVGTEEYLFKPALRPFNNVSRQQFVVSRDGQRFLIASVLDEPTEASPLTLVLNRKKVR